MIDLEPLQGGDEHIRRGDQALKRGSTDVIAHNQIYEEDDLLVSASGYKAKRPPGIKKQVHRQTSGFMTREAYYGYFSDHERNGGIFYNLDEIKEARRGPKSEYKTEFAYNDVNELYEFYEKIGEGAFSDVYRCKFLPTDEIIAVKVSFLLLFVITIFLIYRSQKH